MCLVVVAVANLCFFKNKILLLMNVCCISFFSFFLLPLGLRAGVGVAPGSMFFVDDPANSGLIRIHVGITHEKAKQIAQTLLDYSRNK